MFNPKYIILVASIFISVGDSWNIFPSLTKTSLESFAKEKISTLKNLRHYLEKSQNDLPLHTKHYNKPSLLSGFALILNQINPHAHGTPHRNFTDMTLEDAEKLQKLSVTTVAKALSTMSDKTRNNLLQQMLPNKHEFLNKITEVGDMIIGIKEELQPKVKRFLADRYNIFLSNLVPYSETIGIPIYVLNSLKIPKNFDPRDQHQKKMSNQMEGQGRSDDDQYLLSDQEPYGDNKGRKKYQHIFLSPRSRPQPQPYMMPDRYGGENSFDRMGNSYGQDTMDSELYPKGYTLEDSSYAATDDLYAAAGSHGRGHGHYQQMGQNIDPFTILAGLAFLTFLAMLLQQALMTTAAPGGGRRMADQWELEQSDLGRIPEIINKLEVNDTFQVQNKTDFGTRVDSTFVKVIPVVQCSKLCQLLRNLISIPKLLAKSK